MDSNSSIGVATLGLKFLKDASEGNLMAVNKYIKEKGDLSFRGEEGDTALLYASYYGHLEIVESLIAADKKLVEEVNFNGDSALSQSARRGHTQIIEVLLPYFSEEVRNKKNDMGQTPLMLAMEGDHHRAANALVYAVAVNHSDCPSYEKKWTIQFTHTKEKMRKDPIEPTIQEKLLLISTWQANKLRSF